LKYTLDRKDTRIGTASIRASNDDNTNVSRTSIVPGSWDASGNWVATDITTIPQEVRAEVIALWSADVIAAYRTAFPYVAPKPPTSEEIARAARRANVAAKALRTRLLTATNAEIDTYVDTTVSNVADARTMFKQILKLIAADMRED